MLRRQEEEFFMKSIDIYHFANFAFLNHLKVSNGKKAAFMIKKAKL